MKLVFLLLLLSLSVGVNAQKAFILEHQAKNGFVALSAGISLPTGRFANLSSTDEQAGMAQRGHLFSASAGYQVLGPVGLMARYTQHQNPMQIDSRIDALYKLDGDHYTAQAGNWSVSSIMAGPYVHVPIGLLSVSVRGLVGTSIAICPPTRLDGNLGDVQTSISTNQASGRATVYGAGITMQYRLGRSIAIHLNGDYTQGQYTFSNMSSTAKLANFEQTTTFSSAKQISTFSFSAGITLLFGNRNRVF